ncbi:MAG: hypothetical protein O2856_08300 [Planctomycetota bacterium]|nr:hypothetical protein [Planctomycetota bacterium]
MFGLGGASRFSAGGIDGFRLMDMGLNSVTVNGATLDISADALPPSGNPPPLPTGFAAELTSLPGNSVDAKLLNRRKFMDVTYFVPEGTLLDPASILDGGAEFTLRTRARTISENAMIG